MLKGVDQGIEAYEKERTRYEAEMEKQSKKHLMIRNLDGIRGIGIVGAVKIAARVVDARRFKDKGKWLSYCGLVRLEKLSGSRSYGWKNPRYCRTMKGVFKTAVRGVIGGENNFNKYYDFLLTQKHYSEHNARHAVARKIATIAWAVMKSGKPFDLTDVNYYFSREL